MKPKRFQAAAMRRPARRNYTLCAVCYVQTEIGKEWDDDMQMAVQWFRCPNGHEWGMWWRRPTKADISDFGLVRTA